MSRNDQIRRQLGGMPTGAYSMAEKESRIVHHEVEDRLSSKDQEPGVWVPCFQPGPGSSGFTLR